MDVVILQLLQLLFGVGIAGSFLWALVPRGTGPARTRHRAEWLSVGLGLVVTYLVLVVVRRLTGPGGPDPLGLIPFLTLAAVVPLAYLVLRTVWRRALRDAAAQHEADAQHDPTVDPTVPPPRHRGLSGEAGPPPTRW